MQTPIFIKREDLVLHQNIVGSTGSGKTRAVMQQIVSISKLPNTNFLGFFSEGNESALLPFLNKNVLVLDCSNNGIFRFDPLGLVPGISTQDNVSSFLNSFTIPLWLGISSYGALMPMVEEIIKDKINGRQRNIHDLVNSVRGMKRGELRDKILNRLEIIAGTKLFDCYDANIEIIANSNILFMIGDVDAYSRMLFVNSIISKLLLYKKQTEEHLK